MDSHVNRLSPKTWDLWAFWTNNTPNCREHAAVVWQFSATATEVLSTLVVVAQKDIIREGVSMSMRDAFANRKRTSLRAFALEADCQASTQTSKKEWTFKMPPGWWSFTRIQSVDHPQHKRLWIRSDFRTAQQLHVLWLAVTNSFEKDWASWKPRQQHV